MLKYPCLVLDHDDTVVQSEATVNFPFFEYILAQWRPGRTVTLQEYVDDCCNLGFANMCRRITFSMPGKGRGTRVLMYSCQPRNSSTISCWVKPYFWRHILAKPRVQQSSTYSWRVTVRPGRH